MAVAILSLDNKREIWELFSDGETKANLARKFGVSTRTIGRVIDEMEMEEELDEEENDYWGDEDSEEEDEDFDDDVEELFTYILTPDSISITLVTDDDTTSQVIDKDNENFEKAYNLIFDNKGSQESLKEAYSLVDVKYSMDQISNGLITIIPEEYRATYTDPDTQTEYQFSGKLSQRLLDAAMNKDEDRLEGLMNFAAMLMENPSYRAVNELYQFLEACDIEIDKDGYVICFKRVRDNYMDVHSGKFDNSPGNLVHVNRNQVDENSENTCSYGLHVCSKAYLGSYSGARIIRTKVHPRDFVAIPKDYYSGPSGSVKAKARVCCYFVLDDVTDIIHTL